MRPSSLALLALTAATGCLASTGEWSGRGFQQKTYGWRADYPAGQAKLLGPDWQLDNWQNENGQLVAKSGERYVAVREEDENRDGTIDASERKQVFIYDLKFVNAHNNGVIWVQTHPLHDFNADKDLDVMLRNYADSLSGTGLYEEGSVFGLRATKARSFTTFVNDQRETRLGPHRALSASIELAETERLRDDPSRRASKLRIVLTKFEYLVRLAAPAGTTQVDVPAPGDNQGTSSWKKQTAVMLVGYANDVEHFDAGLQDFEAFTSRLDWPAVLPSAPAPAPPPGRALPQNAPPVTLLTGGPLRPPG
jgi:hypothetical protein